MRRIQLDRDFKEMAKLIGISLLAIILYLCFSFSNAYGYQISNLDRIQIENPAKINWHSDSWLSSNVESKSAAGVNFNNGITGSTGGEFLDDRFPGGDKVIPSIPEPTVTILFGLGLGALALYRRFRN